MAVDGEFELVYGTSCSSPVSASILTAVNDARLAIGKSPIGFINPTVCVQQRRDETVFRLTPVHLYPDLHTPLHACI